MYLERVIWMVWTRFGKEIELFCYNKMKLKSFSWQKLKFRIFLFF